MPIILDALDMAGVFPFQRPINWQILVDMYREVFHEKGITWATERYERRQPGVPPHGRAAERADWLITARPGWVRC
jgi:hypothetical protein